LIVDDSSNVRILIGTTDGPVDLLRLVQEKPVVRRSDVYIGSSTERAGIGRAYNEFVSGKTGLIERVFGKGAYRINVSDRIDAGSSWQLGFFLAHALKTASRLMADDQSQHETVVWTTGTVRSADFSVGEIGYLGKKLSLSLERLLAEAKQGKRVLVAYPAVNAAEIDSELRRSIQNTGAAIIELDSARQLLRELALPPIASEVAAADKIWKGTPFRNLEPFESRHRDIFFGRGRAREEALERLRRAAAREFPFLLVHGRSGAGKSSLVRAGLLGDIKAQASEAEIWLDCIITPQRSAEAPLRSLVEALYAQLPQMSSTLDASSLLEDVRTRSPRAIETIRDAITATGSGRTCKLILVIDQLEELLLWTRERPDVQAANDREAFGDVIAALCRSGAVWTVATLRSDLLGSLDDSPALSRLANDDNIYRLERPTRMEFREIVLRPVAAAELKLEGADPQGLPFADVLIDKASASPDSLPLLQFVLSRLFELEGRTGRLTYTMYARLQGLEGAIGRLAEDNVQALVRDGIADQAIDQVILSLGRYDRDLTTITARWTQIPKESELRDQVRIIEALAKARLLVLDEGGRTRVAHEAVLTHWPRAKTLFETAARDLDLRDLLEPDAEVWEAQGRDPAFLMPAGRRLTEAADLSSANRVLLSDPARRFVAASLEAARKAADAENARLQAEALKERSWRRRAVAAGLTLAVLTVIAAWFAKDARDQASLAAAQTEVANQKKKEANDFAAESDLQRQAAQAAAKQARDSAEEASLREASARALLEIQSNPEQGLETAMGAFKQNLDSGKALLTDVYSSAWKAIDATRQVKQIRTSRPWLNDVRAIVPSPDGSRILIATANGIQIFDMEGRQLIAPIADTEQINTESTAAAWQPNGEHFVVAQALGEGLRLYGADGTFVRTLFNPSGVDVTACLFLDDERVAVGTSDGKSIVLSLDGKVLNEQEISKTSGIAGLAYNYNRLVGAEASPKVDDPTQKGAEEASDEAPPKPALNIEALPNLLPPGARCLAKSSGGLLAVCGSEGRVDFWNFFGKVEHKRTIQAHAGKVNAIAFHPSGKFLATAGDDGLIRLFSADGEAIQSPIRRSGAVVPVNALAFVDNGNKLVSDCDSALCIWDVSDIGIPKSVDVSDSNGLSSVDESTGSFLIGENQTDGGWSVKVVSSNGESHVIRSSPQDKLRAVVYGQNSNLLALVAGNEVSVLDLASGTTVWSKDVPADGEVRLAFAKENNLLGVVISHGPSGFITPENTADRHSDVRFLVFDANSGEKLAEIQRQSPSPIVDLVSVMDDSNPRFISVTANGVLERWSRELSIMSTETSLQFEGQNGSPRLILSERNHLLLASAASSVGIFDIDLKLLGSVRRLDKAIDALAVSPDGKFYALIAHAERRFAVSDSTRLLRVYDARGQLVIERVLIEGSYGDHPLYFGELGITTLQGYNGLTFWPMGPKAALKMGTERLAYYLAERKRAELESLAEKAFTNQRYRDAAKLFSQAIDIDPVNSDQHSKLGNALVFGAENTSDWEAADNAYSRGIALQPYDSIWFLQRGKERFKSGRFAEAEEDFSSGAKFSHFSIPVVRVIAGFLKLNTGIHNLSLFLVKSNINEFYLRRAVARFAQQKWAASIDDINSSERTMIDLDNWRRSVSPGVKDNGPPKLGPVQLDYRGRALFQLGRYNEAYSDLRQASSQLGREDIKYEFYDLVALTDAPGEREAKRGEMLALAAEAARRSGDVQKMADALADARSAYAAAIAKAPKRRSWQEAVAILP
jgi:WD40 repeat protein